MSQLLLKLVSGSRGQGGHLGFCERLHFKELYFHGDIKDNYGIQTRKLNGDLTSVWTLPTFVNKLFRFQYEALEILFCHPSNLTYFHPFLIPLFGQRQNILCQRLVDRLTDRALVLYKKGFNLKKDIKEPYIPGAIIEALDLLESTKFLMKNGSFYPQSVRTSSDLKLQIKGLYLKRSRIEKIFYSRMQQIRRAQITWTRAKTEKERYRGEGPQPKIAPLLSRDTREFFKETSRSILSRLLSGEKPSKINESEVQTLYGQQSKEGIWIDYDQENYEEDSVYEDVGERLDPSLPWYTT